MTTDQTATELAKRLRSSTHLIQHAPHKICACISCELKRQAADMLESKAIYGELTHHLCGDKISNIPAAFCSACRTSGVYMTDAGAAKLRDILSRTAAAVPVAASNHNEKGK